MSDTPLKPATGDTLAAEYALGLLDSVEHAGAQARRLADPAFAQEVEAWEARLAALADGAAPVAPPPSVWSRISQQVAEGGGGEANSGVVVRLERRVALWRSATAVAASLAACLLAALVWPHSETPHKPVLTARLSAMSGGPAVFVALYDPERRSIVLTPAQVKMEAGRSPELWLIPPGGKPSALGVANFVGSAQLVSMQAPQGLAAGALAVSIEPKGGSPTGQPTGPVIATGRLSRL
jgi:anti-sigma-K factor RskA